MNYQKFARLYSYKSEEWVSDPSLTHVVKKTGKTKTNDFLKKEVEKSEKTLLGERRNVTAGRVIAELNLGFWNSLYETHHYALLQGVPCTIFRGLPTGYGRKEINHHPRYQNYEEQSEPQ
jgi:hypothetical protein